MTVVTITGLPPRLPHAPRSHQEVLAAAVAEMTMEDALQAYLAGRPTGLRRPRKTLRAYLAGRR